MKRGVVIAMNPQTGEILAMVSLPTYDNNLFARGHQQRRTTRSSLNEPGQAAHQPRDPGATTRPARPTSSWPAPAASPTARSPRRRGSMTKGYLTLGGTKFYDWNRRGWGPCDIYCGFGHSSDTFFYQVAGDARHRSARRTGPSNTASVRRPASTCPARSAASSRPTSGSWTRSARPIFPGETYQAGIGQGYDVVTPLQLINAYAALANGGTLYQPQVVARDRRPRRDGRPAVRAEVLHEMDVKPSVLRTMRNAARDDRDAPPHLQPRRPADQGRRQVRHGRVRDARPQGPPAVPLVVRRVRAQGPEARRSFDKADSELVVLAFAYDSRTEGNAATEIVKYFCQLHYGIEKDYRIPDLLERGNFYQSD